MSFSHAGDFNRIFLSTINHKISQEKGQGRTAPIPRNSWAKSELFLPERAGPQGRGAKKIVLDNKRHRGKIVIERGGPPRSKGD
jgi:hypothetical protein